MPLMAARRAVKASEAGVSALTEALTRSVTPSTLNQHVEFEAGNFQLFGARACGEAFFGVVLLRSAQLADEIFDDVVVGQHQSVRRDERAGAAVVKRTADI